METTKDRVRSYLLEAFYDPVQNGPLEYSTPLLSAGIIDSISALELVEYLEKEFNIEFQAHEVDQDNLDSIDRISAFVAGKQKT